MSQNCHPGSQKCRPSVQCCGLGLQNCRRGLQNCQNCVWEATLALDGFCLRVKIEMDLAQIEQKLEAF